MLTLPKTVALLYECFTHAGQLKRDRKGIIYWIYRRLFMRNAERAAQFLVDGIVSVQKDVGYDTIEKHVHLARKNVLVKDAIDREIYLVSMKVELIVEKKNALYLEADDDKEQN